MPAHSCTVTSSSSWPALSLHTGHDMLWYQVSLWPGFFWSPFLAMLSLGLFRICSLADHTILKNPWLRVSTAQQQEKHQCAIIIILMPHPKHISVLAAKRKISSIPAGKRAIIYQSAHYISPTSERLKEGIP